MSVAPILFARTCLLWIFFALSLSGAPQSEPIPSPPNTLVHGDNGLFSLRAERIRQEAQQAIIANRKNLIVIRVDLMPTPGVRLRTTPGRFKLLSRTGRKLAEAESPGQVAERLVPILPGATYGSLESQDAARRPGVHTSSDGRPYRPDGSAQTYAGELNSDDRELRNQVARVLESDALRPGTHDSPVSGLIYFFLPGGHELESFHLEFSGGPKPLNLRFDSPPQLKKD